MTRFRPIVKKHQSPPHFANGEVLAIEQKIGATGDPYLQLRLGTWYNFRGCGERLPERTCNRFFTFDKNATFDQKLAKVAEFAQDFPVGAYCLCKTGVFTGRDGQPKVCVTDVYKSKEQALAANPGSDVDN